MSVLAPIPLSPNDSAAGRLSAQMGEHWEGAEFWAHPTQDMDSCLPTWVLRTWLCLESAHWGVNPLSARWLHTKAHLFTQ